MTNRQAGKVYEAKCRKFMESIGWTVDTARAAVRWIAPGKAISSANDFFGCGDLLCIHKDKPFLVVIQCTHSKSIAIRRNKMEAVAWNLAIQYPQVWSPVDGLRGGVRTDWLRGGAAPFWVEHLWRMQNGVEPVGGFL